MSALTLFYASGTCALATLIALEESGAAYTLHTVDFSQQEQLSPAFLALNPKGRVPALRLPDGTVLAESLALLAYVAQAYPAARLAPTAPADFARMQAFNSYLASTVHVAHAHRRRGSRWADSEAAIAAMQAKVPQNMADCFTYIETHALQGPWVLGEDYSVADAYLFTMAGWLAGDGVDIQQFPKVAAHTERMRARAAVQAALQHI